MTYDKIGLRKQDHIQESKFSQWFCWCQKTIYRICGIFRYWPLFSGFSEELESLENQYSNPSGALIIAYSHEGAAACVGLRQLTDEIAELKRMYVRPALRGRKIGLTLMDTILSTAKHLGYKKIRLDTLSTMKEAIQLYKSFGFTNIEAYRHNPLEGALFMEKELW